MTELDFQGFDEDYSALHVAVSDDGLHEATRLGNRYYFHSGEHIDDIAIVRETVSEVVIGTVTDVPIPTSYGSDTIDARYVVDRIVLPVEALLREADCCERGPRRLPTAASSRTLRRGTPLAATRLLAPGRCRQ